jgi:hypothetical protein
MMVVVLWLAFNHPLIFLHLAIAALTSIDAAMCSCEVIHWLQVVVILVWPAVDGAEVSLAHQCAMDLR